MQKVNPFRPGSIISPGMFAGRVNELKELDAAFHQTKNGNPRHFLIHGERGIGKSSLMLFADYVARGVLKGFETQNSYNFLTVNIEIAPSMSLIDVVSSIEAELKNEIEAVHTSTKIFSDIWDFAKKWEICGVKYNSDTARPMVIIPELVRKCVSICQANTFSSDGIVIFIDEADNASAETHLGQFVKIFTERLTKRDCHNVVLGVSGISSVYDVLNNSHESAVRILNSFKLEPLEHNERIEVVRMGLDQSDKQGYKVSITPEAEDWIARYSEGFPHFIQQYASSAFERDGDRKIDLHDVVLGANGENGALDQLGERYFNDMYHARINSDEYRAVLNAMAAHPNKFVARKEIMEASGLKKTKLDNALRSLKQKEVIIPHPNKMGLYRLPSDSFGAWIRAQTAKEKSDDIAKGF